MVIWGAGQTLRNDKIRSAVVCELNAGKPHVVAGLQPSRLVFDNAPRRFVGLLRIVLENSRTSPELKETLVLPLRQTDHPQFFRLANYYRSQTDPFTCGPVSGAIVLNALRHRSGFPHTRTSFLNERAQSIRSLAQIYDPVRPGMSVGELKEVLEVAHDLKVQFSSGEKGRQVKRDLVSALATRDRFVIVNFSRVELGQIGSGHFSPLGAYDEASDSFFVLDTNPAVSPWTWVPADKLIAAMATKDEGAYRGALMVGL